MARPSLARPLIRTHTHRHTQQNGTQPTDARQTSTAQTLAELFLHPAARIVILATESTDPDVCRVGQDCRKAGERADSLTQHANARARARERDERATVRAAECLRRRARRALSRSSRLCVTLASRERAPAKGLPIVCFRLPLLLLLLLFLLLPLCFPVRLFACLLDAADRRRLALFSLIHHSPLCVRLLSARHLRACDAGQSGRARKGALALATERHSERELSSGRPVVGHFHRLSA